MERVGVGRDDAVGAIIRDEGGCLDVGSKASDKFVSSCLGLTHRATIKNVGWSVMINRLITTEFTHRCFVHVYGTHRGTRYFISN